MTALTDALQPFLATMNDDRLDYEVYRMQDLIDNALKRFPTPNADNAQELIDAIRSTQATEVQRFEAEARKKNDKVIAFYEGPECKRESMATLSSWISMLRPDAVYARSGARRTRP